MADDEDADELPAETRDKIAELAESGSVAVTTEVEGDPADPDEGFGVTRSAAFAEVASRPKSTAIEAAERLNDVQLFEALLDLDPELTGTIRGQTQMAAMGARVTHPTLEGEDDEMSGLEEDILNECELLAKDLRLIADMQTWFRSLVVHGNDICHVEYADGLGVMGLTPLPMSALTITDDPPTTNDVWWEGYTQGDGQHTDASEEYSEKTITEANYYVLNEGDADIQDVRPADEILHVALNDRRNWYKDKKGRATFGIYGERRLKPLKWTVQAKQNTLANKVAMDDRLLAREFYRIDVEALWGHIEDDTKRQEKAEEYADELRKKLEKLDPDEQPIIPKEVEVEVKGPGGETAQKMADFIETMNNSIQHALTFHSASFGRDAGGTLAGNRPAREMSEENIRHLREVVAEGFRDLFRLHTLLKFPAARATPDEDEETGQWLDEWVVSDDVVLPTVEFTPLGEQSKNEKLEVATAGYEKGVFTLNEAREEMGLDPLDPEEMDELMFFPGKGAMRPRTVSEQDEREEEMRELEEQQMQQDDEPGDGDESDDSGDQGGSEDEDDG